MMVSLYLAILVVLQSETRTMCVVEEMNTTTTCLDDSILVDQRVHESSSEVYTRQKKLNLLSRKQKKMSLLFKYRRNAMTRYMLAKLAENQNRDEREREKWYEVDVNQFPHHLQEKFVKYSIDDETEQFLASSIAKSGFLFTQFFHSVAQMFLGFMLSTTTLNGLLVEEMQMSMTETIDCLKQCLSWVEKQNNTELIQLLQLRLLDRGKMFVFSNEQFKTLIGIDDACTNKTLLDLGAGDGTITTIMAKYFRSVYVTESSSTMRYRLGQKGFTILDNDDWQNDKFDFISVLNLLDRVDNPSKLLSDIRLSLNPDGTVLLAVVLPYGPCVEKGSELVDPAEWLPVSGESNESQVTSLVQNVLNPAGFHVVKFTKLPYLCEGDLYEDFFYLFDYVFVLKTIDSL